MEIDSNNSDVTLDEKERGLTIPQPKSFLLPFSLLASVFLVLIFGLPVVVTGAVLDLSWATLWRWPALLLAPLIYTVVFVVVAGGLSLPFKSGVVEGKFPRDLRNPIYRKRRLHGLCWTAVYYFKPLYFICLSVPSLKWLLFRLFGYRGNLKFTIYPDSWVRDLPLLDIGEGAYISNRATLATNMALSNGTIIVGGVKLGKNSVVGHLSMLGTWSELEEGAEMGVGSAIGLRCKLRRDSLVQPCCAINHQTTIGVKAVVGSMSYVGTRTLVGDGINIAPGTLVPSRQRITTQTEADQYISAGKRL